MSKNIDKYNIIVNPKSYVGRTYQVNDDDLPHTNQGSGKIVNFAIIEENGKRLGGVRTTTRKTKNAISFKTHHRLYKGYKTFFEIQFQDGNYITAESDKLKENPWVNNLSYKNVDEIRDKVFYHSHQSTNNRDKLHELKNGNKKSRH